MTYIQAHNRPYQSRNRAIGIIAVVLIVIVILLQIFAPYFFASIFTSIVSPFWRTEFAVWSGSLQSPESLLNQNEELKRRLIDAQVRLDTIKAIESENAELKNLLGRESFTLESQILAAVLKRPPFSPYDELIIDIGKDHNLSTSSLVYAVGNILIGRVADILGSTAKVKLFSSPGEKFEVLIGEVGDPITAIGRGGGQYEAQISRDINIKEGDFVINSSLNTKPFGVVFMVLSDQSQTFRTVLFASPVNIYQIRWVLVER